LPDAKTGRRYLAVADFTKAIELYPGDMYAHLVRGAINQERGFTAQAISDLSFVLDEGDGFALVFYLRALCHADKKDYERALADLEEALEHDPHHEKALELKARCASWTMSNRGPEKHVSG
jgi:tetratricopeptide (TPR) repeat protein